ncbi:mRNA cleavage and polyadenylation factor CLP1 [Smittium culicis]|uniref:mRNA cleavage and polyadenylation factor CLP1 n=1 Tax=Smittium culicis TaxID=133412 RepID=A0A1R1Y4M7_9FUNG|nr:mRNA cleavage and polyadenylation factor CLP1 [Smittium culicis]
MPRYLKKKYYTPLIPPFNKVLSPQSLAPSSTLPLGQARKESEIQFVKLEVDEKVSHNLLAVLQVDSQAGLAPQQDDGSAAAADPSAKIDEIAALNSPVLGYINVTLVETAKNHLVVMSPSPGRVPAKVMLTSEIQWIDS